MHDYSWIDESSLQNLNYYRLKQTDFDGTTTISTPIAIRTKKSSGFTVFPNPALTEFNVYSDDESFDMILTDATGKIIFHEEGLAARQLQRFGQLLQRGFYVLIITGKNSQMNYKIFKE